MEIYHLKTDIAAFLKEISVYKADNDKLLNEIKNLMLSEGDVFTEAYETLEKDLETSEKILNDFQEIDVFLIKIIKNLREIEKNRRKL